MTAFTPFPKVPRWNRGVTVTEKIDGTNAAVVIHRGPFVGCFAQADYVDPVTGEFKVMSIGAQSRTRFIKPGDDNFGFAAWVDKHAEELVNLGPGVHFGEWWGKGIQRGYGLTERRFSLFNVERWSDDAVRPACCHVVPVLLQMATLDQPRITGTAHVLECLGSRAAPGFMNPEGIMIWHHAARQMFKFTFDGDGHKGARV